jgi:hypothetical protein
VKILKKAVDAIRDDSMITPDLSDGGLSNSMSFK